MIEIVTLLGSFFLLLIVGMPIAFAMGIAAFVTATVGGLGPAMLVQRSTASMQSFPLITIPLFILAGAIMSRGGVARRIVNFAYILVGPLPGGLGMVNCVQAMIFGGVSGSSVADIASIGPLIIPMMVEKGYDTAFATALTVSASTQGIIVPPSHNVILYAMVISGVSIGKLFLAGYIPGFMLCFALCITCYILALRRGYPREKVPPLSKSLVTIRDGILSIFAAVIIVGGIVFGIFTATEASAVAVLYSLFLTLVIYREMKVKDLWPVCKTVVKTTTAIMLLIGCASAFGWVMSVYQIPVTIAGFFLTITHNRYLLLLLINMLLLVLGCIMDMAPLLLIMAPVLYPIVCVTLGMSPIQFGILLMCNLSIGLTAPPVGSALFVGSTVANIPLEKTARAMLNFWPAMLLVTLIVTYVPWVTMYLPGLFK